MKLIADYIYIIFYGMGAGVAYKLLSAYEYLKVSNREFMWLWKKYPQRSYEQFRATLQLNQLTYDDVSDEQILVSSDILDYKDASPRDRRVWEIFIVVKIFINTVKVITLTPFHALAGIFQGPVYLFLERRERLRCKRAAAESKAKKANLG